MIEAAQDRLPLRAFALDEVSVLILTYNEASNIVRTLDRLGWAKHIFVLDSNSTDETRQILSKRVDVTVLQRRFDSHANQWNYGLAQIQTEWVLSLDADYQLTDEFATEVESLLPTAAVSAYYASFRYCIQGRPLSGTLYPPRAVLFRRSRCHYEQEGHTQILHIDGEVGWLKAVVYHDDRKSLSHWLTAQDRYARLEARHLQTTAIQDMSVPDRLRRWIVPAPLVVFVYTLLIKRLIFDGWPGWYYVLQRTLAEIFLSLRLIEAKLGWKDVTD